MEFLWHTLILVIRIKHRWKTMDLIMDELEDTRISNPCIHQSHSYPKLNRDKHMQLYVVVDFERDPGPRVVLQKWRIPD
uniref:Uncharacterized protein n=1 Tax=Aegilops tauschii subsp. strangulata TaxID=200361 RepID=A0A453DVF2_AEGTS